MSENTLRHVRGVDQTWLKESINTFISWYFMSCQEITDLAEYFGEDDADTVTSILSTGLRTLQERREMMEDGNMKRGDEL